MMSQDYRDDRNPYQPPSGPPPYQDPYYDPRYSPRDVPNYLVYAILCTLFCCLPFGVVAIVYAAQVNGHLAAGNYRAAVSASDSARNWCWASFLSGLVVAVLYFLVIVGMGVH